MIKNFFSDLTFSFYKNNPIRVPVYLGNWIDVLPYDLHERLENYNWNAQPLRNYKEVANRIDLNSEDTQDFLDLAHFKNFQTYEHTQWRITDYESLLTDNKLFTKVDEYFTRYKIWVTQIPPGCCLPQHVDSIDTFINDYNISYEEIPNIKRYMILPLDIKPWHHLWYGRKIISEGLAGDVWSFNFWEPHGGSNLGPTNKYTIQVMGI